MRAAQHELVKEWVTRGLCTAHRLIIVLYYYEGMKMEQIGRTLGLSESRVSQLHKQIIRGMKAKFADTHLAEELAADDA